MAVTHFCSVQVVITVQPDPTPLSNVQLDLSVLLQPAHSSLVQCSTTVLLVLRLERIAAASAVPANIVQVVRQHWLPSPVLPRITVQMGSTRICTLIPVSARERARIRDAVQLRAVQVAVVPALPLPLLEVVCRAHSPYWQRC